MHKLIIDTRQDLQPSENNHLWEKVKEEQTSQAESPFSIMKAPCGPFIYDQTGSSLSKSEPRFVEGTSEIKTQPCQTENTVMSVEKAEPPPLPPKQRNINRMPVQLQRTLTFNDFKFDLGSMDLLEEICIGEEWAKFLPVKDSPLETDAKDYSQTEDSHDSDDDIGSQNAAMKSEAGDREQSEITPSPASITDSQVDRVIQVRDETSDSPISALPKTPIRHVTGPQRISDQPKYEPFKDDENDLVVTYVYDKNCLMKDMPLDLSVVKSSGVLDNSALKSRIQLSKKRKHRPPGKRKKEYSDSLTNDYSQIAVRGNEKVLLQRISETAEFNSNENDSAEGFVLYKNNQLSNKAKLMDEPLDFSAVRSLGVLDNSALKDRIQLSKKRKHRPPGKRKNENIKIKFPILNIIRQRNTTTESFQPCPSSYASVFTSSALHNDSSNSQSPIPGNEKPKTKNKLLKPKLWKIKR
ncbi:hypothetical protein Q7C36_007592 [Tachysurus vachellii]|uniref:Tankyrase 1-binding protein C-terminal domain-containing protein n=1 Tax=Tachysurus vachellii TaxID=175792 RepID=A0AA88SZM6_TACVA|nr:hypothetical protein Q7C36_007592 [Tachysurus vachellii]